jgi:class 3 adenylate cyclase
MNDPETLFVSALVVSNFFGAPQHQEERLRLAEEFSKRPRDGVSTRIQGHHLHETGSVYLTWADRWRAEERWGQLAGLAARSHDPMPLFFSLRTERALAILDGRLEDAIAAWERYVALADELGSVVRQPRFFDLHRALLYLGQLGEAEARSRESDQPEDEELYLLVVRALCLAHLGHSVDARALLLRVMSERGIGVAEDETHTWDLAGLLETAVLVEDREAATVLAGRLAGVAALFTGDTCVARHLGAAAALLGDPAQARAYFEQALEVARKIRYRPEIALTRLQLAELLLAHEPDERAGALAHLNFAIEEFRDMKMQPSLERALRRKVEAQGAGSTDVMTSISAVASAARRDGTDLRPHAAPDGGVTIMFSDIEGSTPINERLGDQRWMDVLRAHNALIREQIAAHDGDVVKTAGDGFMVAFSSPRRAVECALAIQRAFSNFQHPTSNLQIRIGMHTGTPVAEGGDYYGKDVTLAYRIADSAHGGEIVVSARVRELVEGASDVVFGEPREIELKGLSGKQMVYTVTAG